MKNHFDNFNNKSILITGGTGTFGTAFLDYLVKNYKPKKIIIFSRDELKQYYLKEKYSKKDSSEKTEMNFLKSEEAIEKGKVGFWKNHNGKKKYMKDHQIKLKDKDGKDVIGDFKISKEGKVDLTGLKAGKYSAKIKIGSDETLLSHKSGTNF